MSEQAIRQKTVFTSADARDLADFESLGAKERESVARFSVQNQYVTLSSRVSAIMDGVRNIDAGKAHGSNDVAGLWNYLLLPNEQHLQQFHFAGKLSVVVIPPWNTIAFCRATTAYFSISSEMYGRAPYLAYHIERSPEFGTTQHLRIPFNHPNSIVNLLLFFSAFHEQAPSSDVNALGHYFQQIPASPLARLYASFVNYSSELSGNIQDANAAFALLTADRQASLISAQDGQTTVTGDWFPFPLLRIDESVRYELASVHDGDVTYALSPERLSETDNTVFPLSVSVLQSGDLGYTYSHDADITIQEKRKQVERVLELTIRLRLEHCREYVTSSTVPRMDDAIRMFNLLFMTCDDIIKDALGWAISDGEMELRRKGSIGRP